MFLKWSLHRSHQGLQELLAINLFLFNLQSHAGVQSLAVASFSCSTASWPCLDALPPPAFFYSFQSEWAGFLDFTTYRFQAGDKVAPEEGVGCWGWGEPSDDNFRAALSKSRIMMRGEHARPFPVCSPGKRYERIEKGRGEGPMRLRVVGGGN